MTPAAACRARHVKDLLTSAGRLEAAAAARIRGALPKDDLLRIEEASGVEWLPLEMNLRVTRAIHDALGLVEFLRFERTHFATLFRGPVYRAFIQGAAAVFGFDPGGWMRLVPQSWNLTYRDCGAWTIDRGEPERVTMALSELPSACVRDRVWPLAVAAALSATLDVAKCEGSVELTSLSPALGEARFELRWKRR